MDNHSPQSKSALPLQPHWFQESELRKVDPTFLLPSPILICPRHGKTGQSCCRQWPHRHEAWGHSCWPEACCFLLAALEHRGWFVCSYGRTIPTQAGPASSTLCRPCLPACCIMGPARVCSMALLSDPECTSGVGQGTVSGELTDFPSTAHPRFSPAMCQLGCNIATHWCHSTCYRLAISLWPPCSWPLSMVWSHVGRSTGVGAGMGCLGTPLAESVSAVAGI